MQNWIETEGGATCFNVLSVLEKLRREDKELIILGDFNIDYIISDDSFHNNPINNIENLFFLTQIVNKPTRVTINEYI